MKDIRKCYALLSLLALFCACNGQKKTSQSEKTAEQSTPQSTQEKTAPADFDPYFNGNTIVNSEFGPGNITRNIIQDRKGNIWLATWEGIIRYMPNAQKEDESFTNFTNKEGLRRFRVFSILEDRKGHIWFGTIGAGTYLYDGQSFTNITTEDGLVNNRVGCIMEDRAGNIWFGTEGGVSRYDGEAFTNFTTAEGLASNDTNSIVEDKSGKFWFGARGKACTFDGNEFIQLVTDEGMSFDNVRSIIEDKSGNIWLAGSNGLWRFDGSSYTNFTKNFVGYVYEDRERNIWTSSVNSSDGNNNEWMISRYDNASLRNKKELPTQIISEQGMFFGIMEDIEGGFWFGTLNGVYRYDGKDFTNFRNSVLRY